MEKLLNRLEGDRIIWGVMITLSMFSILIVYSATGSLAYMQAGGDNEHYLLRHSTLVIVGIIGAYVCHKIDYIYYSRLSRYALLLSIPLLLFTWFFGSEINSASRWIEIPFINFTFQPSDLARLALIANMASMLWKRQRDIGEFNKAIVPLLVWTGIICGLIGVSDISTASLLFLTIMLQLFIGRVPVKYLFMLIAIGCLAALFVYQFGQRGGTAVSRLSSFMSETEIPYQAEQSYIAISTGGISGKGIGESTQRNFLPHSYSDFVFAIVVEEYGLIGALVIIGLYITLLYRGMAIVATSQKAFGGLLAAGLTFSLILQAFVHMGVVTGLLPLTGLPLPLVSMGGTSLLFTGMTIGIILSVSKSTQEDSEEIRLKRTERSKKRKGYDGINRPKNVRMN
ncbi:FtsW/RodA/SpoVE family cell cycle protein [Flammeovirga yaeyamensis]|uniref:Probable peptidoglycan glycosyltransferase FtsW n=1 Tax=Flammeovirga yaeyamensis TaxID=367791 RepID=A0AAX1N7D6_9BACT|nr:MULTISPECIES: FtsW/RodA/SpoVE family cell cycle protein [Flammeovirga]ANQ49155.1 FtsW/RodA/SpoVE family cell cycle protein [Flammeovirga sp. MY04]MBB3697982.1 cell division protein FtsW [Flammeovirga yaeyamensis]NMF35666.1 FtsW/RodA/SpoVE family cell cycle protein [Flammeovirga yaeyamensis]QWG03379.1 FtsW/RodA/SpoVE family cell cycle protein [Flammeovirga yaeyamensis]